MTLSNYIADLLLKNNCVIVPNFGGFIANYKSAVIDNSKNRIFPPSKSVLFNNALTSNDGLLANYVAQKLELSYASSLNKIDEKSTEWKSSLKNGERIHIGEIGFLFSDNGKIQFEQNREFNLLLDAYGLSAVQFMPVIEGQVSTTKESEPIIEIKKSIVEPVLYKVETPVKGVDDAKVIPITESKKGSSKVWKRALVACAIPVLFYSYWIPINSNVLETGNIIAADFNPFSDLQKRTYHQNKLTFEANEIDANIDWNTLTEKIDADIYNFQFSESLYIPVNLKSESEVNPSENSNEINKEGNLHLVAGCFSSKVNANNLINELSNKGYNAYLVDKNKGLYRVSAGNFSSKSELNQVKNDLSSANINTWVLNK
jgi:hypothetical protein